MPTPPPVTFDESFESLICRALVLLINADPYFATYYSGRARYIPPSIRDDLLILPECLVQNAYDRDALNRNVGKTAQPTVNARVLLMEMERTEPYADGDTDKIMNRLVHLEKLVERGSLGAENECTGEGLLINPETSFGDPANVRYLNDLMPTYSKRPVQRIDISPDEDQALIAVVYPVDITYKTRQHRLTRKGF